MGNKFKYLVKQSLKKKVNSKWFVVVNVVLAIMIIGLLNIDQIITFFGGNFDESVKVVVVDKTNETYPLLEQELQTSKNILNEETKIEVKNSKTNEKEEIKSMEDDSILIVLEEDQNNFIKAKVISNGYIDTFNYQIVSQALINTKSLYALNKSDIDKEELAKISNPIEIERQILDETKKTSEENDSLMMGTVFPTIILPFFMLTIFLVQMIGADICEEKTTRSMEIIISNVSPKVHFFSKIVAANFFVIIQGLLLFTYAVIGFVIQNNFSASTSVTGGLTEGISSLWSTLVTSGFTEQLIYVVPLTLILMLLSFLAYSLVAGILASMTVNMEDFQQIQTPIILISLVGYYLAIMSSMFNGSILIRILSYVPFISSLLSPALLVMGQISVIDVIISIVILLIFDWIMIRYGMKVYKSGILNYSNEKVWNRLKRAIHSKES